MLELKYLTWQLLGPFFTYVFYLYYIQNYIQKVGYLWRSMRSSSTLFEFLHENFPDDHIIFVSEYRREHHRHTIFLRFYVSVNITIF